MWIPFKETIFNSSGGSCTLISSSLHCFSRIIRYSEPEIKRLFSFYPPPPISLPADQNSKVFPTKKRCGEKNAWSFISLHFMTLSYENTRSRFPSSLPSLLKADPRMVTRPFAVCQRGDPPSCCSAVELQMIWQWRWTCAPSHGGRISFKPRWSEAEDAVKRNKGRSPARPRLIRGWHCAVW